MQYVVSSKWIGGWWAGKASPKRRVVCKVENWVPRGLLRGDADFYVLFPQSFAAALIFLGLLGTIRIKFPPLAVGLGKGTEMGFGSHWVARQEQGNRSVKTF
jgi:hypothetical protein